MTENQRLLIHQLRSSGFGYGRIAQRTGLGKSSVANYCRAHGISTAVGINAGISSQPCCPQCGRPIEPGNGRRRRRFCSQSCYHAWWLQSRMAASPSAGKSICLGCGKPIISYGSKARRFCSHECYISYRFHKEKKSA